MEQTTAPESVAHQTFCGLSLGEVQVLAGCLEEALTLAEHTLARARARHERDQQAYALRLLGDLTVRRELQSA